MVLEGGSLIGESMLPSRGCVGKEYMYVESVVAAYPFILSKEKEPVSCRVVVVPEVLL